ncbi:MAG: TIGR02147 family protein [Deltaproteobacteria bacterium]|nr:MAG: TIGR02147 family protein [Deltaproteobacteria bacterium]
MPMAQASTGRSVSTPSRSTGWPPLSAAGWHWSARGTAVSKVTESNTRPWPGLTSTVSLGLPTYTDAAAGRPRSASVVAGRREAARRPGWVWQSMSAPGVGGCPRGPIPTGHLLLGAGRALLTAAGEKPRLSPLPEAPDMPEPSVFDYVDYRRFLRDWLNWKCASRPGYGMGVFAMNAGLSRSTLANVLAGRRQPTPESLDGFARAMGLDDDARHYLGRLVDLSRATNLDEHAAILRELFDHQRYGHGQRVDVAQLEGLSRWYAMAIHEMAGLPGFVADADWLAARLQPPADRDEVARVLDEMRSAGLLDDDPVHRLHTPPEVEHLGAYRLHQSAIDAAKDALVAVPHDRRSFHLATLSVPRDKVSMLFDELEALVRRLRELADAERADADAVVQVNVQAWLAGLVGGEGEPDAER